MPAPAPTTPVVLGPDRTVLCRELTMGEFALIQKHLNKLARPSHATPEIAAVLDEAGTRFAAQVAQVDLPPEAKSRLLKEFGAHALRLTESLVREARWEDGMWPPEAGTPKGSLALFTSEGGKAHFTWVMLRQSDPSVTHEQAAEVFDSLTPRAFYALVEAAFPSPPEAEADGEADDPKAGPPA